MTHIKKGLYVSNIDRNISIGYDSKITGQIKGLMKQGLQFELICLSESDKVILRQFSSEYNDFYETASTFLHQCSENIISRRRSLFTAVVKRLAETKIDILYLRYPRSDPLYLAFLFRVRRLHPYIKIFCEFPTFPYDQELATQKSLKQLLMVGLDRSTRSFLKHFISKATVVDYSNKAFGIESIEISNGISVDRFPMRKPKQKRNESVVYLLGVANVKPWHGYDRVIAGLGNYYHNLSNDKEVFFRVVGACEPVLSDLKMLAHKHRVEKHVLFYPPAQGEALEILFDTSDIAISTLGAHRIGLRKLSPLKTREYCARTIPFVLGYTDADFSRNYDYALTVPADDTPVDIEGVLKFLHSIQNDCDARKNMRGYAEKYLDWSKKMEPVARSMF